MTGLNLTSEEERAMIEERRLTFNDSGERVLVGLTLVESIWYIETGRDYAARGKRAFGSQADADSYFSLQARHYAAAADISFSVDERIADKSKPS